MTESDKAIAEYAKKHKVHQNDVGLLAINYPNIEQDGNAPSQADIEFTMDTTINPEVLTVGEWRFICWTMDIADRPDWYRLLLTFGRHEGTAVRTADLSDGSLKELCRALVAGHETEPAHYRAQQVLVWENIERPHNLIAVYSIEADKITIL